MTLVSTYTAEKAAEVCAAIADGKTIRKVCKMPGMPCKATVFRWLRDNPDFARMYEIATEERADTMIDEIVEIADNVKTDADSIRKAKLRIHARVEQAMKMKPRKYGPRMQLTGEGGGPIRSALNVTGLSTSTLAEIMAAKDAAERG